MTQMTTRLAGAAVAVGLCVAGLAPGVARADSDGPAPGQAASADRGSSARAASTSRAGGRSSSVRGGGPTRAQKPPPPRSAPVRAIATAAGTLPAPTSTTPTPYGDLGRWMINKNDRIADWIGQPQPVSGTLKTILESINVILVDTASGDARQSTRNLNAWMARSGFGASAFSSTGYQGVLGSTTYDQQPDGANQAFRDAFFLFDNSHARAFGPHPNPSGPGFVWTASLSEENWTITNPLAHGYESFMSARDTLRSGMIAAGAGDLGELFMDNVIDEGVYSTGDADGYAVVLELNSVLKAATTPRGFAVGRKPGT